MFPIHQKLISRKKSSGRKFREFPQCERIEREEGAATTRTLRSQINGCDK